MDEFVPQFYDASFARLSAGIAEPIDPQKWSRIFEEFETPYKIGISSFGRIARRRVTPEGPVVQYFRDAAPVDFAGQGRPRTISATPAGELIVRYDIQDRPLRQDLQPGDVVEITFPTAESVRKAYHAVRQFGRYCTGVAFFRWPTHSETLALTAGEIAAILDRRPESAPALELHDGSCVERQCRDIYLKLGRDSAVAGTDRTFQIAIRGSLELFLPGRPIRPVRSNAGIAVTIPAYSGLRSVYVGRVISANAAQLEVQLQ